MMTVRENSRCPGKLKSQMNNGMCLKYCMGCEKVKVLVTQSCHTLCDPLVCSPPGSSVYGILQARILEWIAIPSPEDLPNPGIELMSPALVGKFFTTEPPSKPSRRGEETI